MRTLSPRNQIYRSPNVDYQSEAKQPYTTNSNNSTLPKDIPIYKSKFHHGLRPTISKEIRDIRREEELQRNRDIQAKKRREEDLVFRRIMDDASDQEFAQLQVSKRRRIDRLPFWSKTSALAELDAEKRRLERARLKQRGRERRQRGDLGA